MAPFDKKKHYSDDEMWDDEDIDNDMDIEDDMDDEVEEEELDDDIAIEMGDEIDGDDDDEEYERVRPRPAPRVPVYHQEPIAPPKKYTIIEDRYIGIKFDCPIEGKKDGYFDKRIAKRQISRNYVTLDEAQKYNEMLPDCSDNVDYISDEQLEEYDKISDRIKRIMNLRMKELSKTEREEEDDE